MICYHLFNTRIRDAVGVAGAVISLLNTTSKVVSMLEEFSEESSQTQNMATSWKARERGYPQLAAYIAADEDKSITIYRRFERLAARNLLYLESELADLEAKQDELDQQSRKANDKIAAEKNLQQLSTLAVGLETKLREKEKEEKRLETVSTSPEVVPKTGPDVISPANPVGGARTVTTDGEKSEFQKQSELKDKVMKRLKVAAAIRRALKEYCEYCRAHD
jgi:hypothetical protein